GDVSGGGEDEPGGGFGGFVRDEREHAGVGVGGQHDAGGAEVGLDGLEVDAGGVGGARRAGAQGVGPDRRGARGREQGGGGAGEGGGGGVGRGGGGIRGGCPVHRAWGGPGGEEGAARQGGGRRAGSSPAPAGAR